MSHDSAATSSTFVTVRRTTSRPTGTIIEPPIPCTTRAKTSISMDFDMPQSTEPTVKMRMATRNTSRAPSRSANQPEAGRNTAMVSR